jgi:hypothetical protein
MNGKQTLALSIVSMCAFTAACSAGTEGMQRQVIVRCTQGAEFPLGKSFLEDFGQNGETLASKPADVQCFVENAAACEHFAGEEPYDEERRSEILAAMDKSCGNAQNLSGPLKDKYNKDVDILRILAICDKDTGAVCSSFGK